MIREINKDVEILKRESSDCTIEDLNLSIDLLDTVKHHKDKCVGMALNMIGINKNMICYLDDLEYKIMINPVILSFKDKYETEEGCLSLEGVRKTIRYKKIKVQYYDEFFKIKIKTFFDFKAQIIQHEIDHLKGIII